MKMAVNTAKLLKNVPLPDETTHVHDNGVVIDAGGSTVKAGFSGDDSPRVVVPTVTGVPRGRSIGDPKEMLACQRAYRMREDYDLTWPIERSQIVNWDSMERIWEHLYRECLKIPSDDSNTPVLLTEPALNPKDNRETMCQIFFEKLKVPSIYVSIAPVLGLYASGRTTGIALECGNATMHTVPIFEGFSLFHSILQLDYGGYDLTQWFRNSLAEKGITFPAQHERDICGFLKERLCAVAQDYRSVGEKPPVTYTLPDGREITAGSERYTCCEALFDPSAIGLEERRGLPTVAIESIKKCDGDIAPLLYNNVVLCGGTSMFSGVQDRLFKELNDLAPAEKIKIFAATERKYSTWIGGSILASLPTFQDFWVTRQEYEEGERGRVVHRNCF